MSNRKTAQPRIVLGGHFARTFLAFALFWCWEAALVYAPSIRSARGELALFWAISNYGTLIAWALLVAGWQKVGRWAGSAGCRAVTAVLLEAGTLMTTVPAVWAPPEGWGGFPGIDVVGGCCYAVGIMLMDLHLVALAAGLPSAFSRRVVVMGAMVCHLLMYLLVDNAPMPANLAVVAVLPLLAAGAAKPSAATRRSLAQGAGDSFLGVLRDAGSVRELVRVPPVYLLAFFVISFSINFIRNELVRRIGESNPFSGSPTVSLTLLLLLAALFAACACALRGKRDPAPAFSAAYVTAAIAASIGLPDEHALALSFTFGGFFLYVTMFYRVAVECVVQDPSRFAPVVVSVFFSNSLGLSLGTLACEFVRPSPGDVSAFALVALAYLVFVAGTAIVFADKAGKGRKVFDRRGDGGVFGNAAAGGESLEEAASERIFRPRLSAAIDDACERAAEEFGLTGREKDALRLLARHRDYLSIAEVLGVSPNTVKSHTRHIYQKMGVHSSAELFGVLERMGEAGG